MIYNFVLTEGGNSYPDASHNFIDQTALWIPTASQDIYFKICAMSPFLINLLYTASCHMCWTTEIGKFRYDYINIIGADAMTPCAITHQEISQLPLIMQDKGVFVFHNEGFQLPTPYKF